MILLILLLVKVHLFFEFSLSEELIKESEGLAVNNVDFNVVFKYLFFIAIGILILIAFIAVLHFTWNIYHTKRTCDSIDKRTEAISNNSNIETNVLKEYDEELKKIGLSSKDEIIKQKKGFISKIIKIVKDIFNYIKNA